MHPIISIWVIFEQLAATEEHEVQQMLNEKVIFLKNSSKYRAECRIAGVTDFNSSEPVHSMTSIFFANALNLEGEILR